MKGTPYQFGLPDIFGFSPSFPITLLLATQLHSLISRKSWQPTIADLSDPICRDVHALRGEVPSFFWKLSPPFSTELLPTRTFFPSTHILPKHSIQLEFTPFTSFSIYTYLFSFNSAPNLAHSHSPPWLHHSKRHHLDISLDYIPRTRVTHVQSSVGSSQDFQYIRIYCSTSSCQPIYSPIQHVKCSAQRLSW